jgi:hypothetical protein
VGERGCVSNGLIRSDCTERRGLPAVRVTHDIVAVALVVADGRGAVSEGFSGPVGLTQLRLALALRGRAPLPGLRSKASSFVAVGVLSLMSHRHPHTSVQFSTSQTYGASSSAGRRFSGWGSGIVGVDRAVIGDADDAIA